MLVFCIVCPISADVTCWCPDGGSKREESVADVCQAAAERSTEGKCTGDMPLISGFSGTVSAMP